MNQRSAGKTAKRSAGEVLHPSAVIAIAAIVAFLAALSTGTSSAETRVGADETALAEARLDTLADDLQTIGQATYLHEQAALQWRIDQSYEQGEDRCLGETLQREILGSTTPNAELLWDRHVRRRFSFADLRTIAVKPSAKPNLYMPAELVSGPPDAYTVIISTAGNDIEIQYHGFDGGDIVAADAPLFFSTYYHPLFVITLKRARDVAADLQARAEECGAPNVEMYDLTR